MWHYRQENIKHDVRESTERTVDSASQPANIYGWMYWTQQSLATQHFHFNSFFFIYYPHALYLIRFALFFNFFFLIFIFSRYVRYSLLFSFCLMPSFSSLYLFFIFVSLVFKCLSFMHFSMRSRLTHIVHCMQNYCYHFNCTVRAKETITTDIFMI